VATNQNKVHNYIANYISILSKVQNSIINKAIITVMQKLTMLKFKIKKLLLTRSEYDDPVEHYVKYVTTPNSVLHCGAHLGEEYSKYKELGINEIFWNEAQPNLVDQLVQRFGRDHVFPGVVSNKDNNPIDFYLTDNSLSSSTKVIDPINDWNIKLVDKVELKSVTLDTILRKILRVKNELPKLIILDLQGGEFEALENSIMAITNDSDFVVEMAQYQLYIKQKTDIDIVNLFKKFGYLLVFPKNKKLHYDGLFLSPNSQIKYYRRKSVLKRILSRRKSKLVDILYKVRNIF
jgi:FkbM family methyltransferase